MFSPYTATLVECFAKAQTIDGISFEFCPREANHVAHHLAKHAYDNQLELIHHPFYCLMFYTT